MSQATASTLRAQDRASYVIGEVEHIIGTREPRDVATALGYANVKSLVRMLGRWGRHDLAVRIERQDRAVAA